MSIGAALALAKTGEGGYLKLPGCLECLHTEVESSGKWGQIGFCKCAPRPRGGGSRDR